MSARIEREEWEAAQQDMVIRLRAELDAKEEMITALQEQMSRLAEQHARAVAEAREEQLRPMSDGFLKSDAYDGARSCSHCARFEEAGHGPHCPFTELRDLRAECAAANKRIAELEAKPRTIPEHLMSQYERVLLRRTEKAESALAAEVEQHQATAKALESITDELERTVAEADRPKGGMSVPFHGDFAGALRVPSMLSRVRWWARELRASLPAGPREDR